VPVGEPSIVIAVSSPHRKEAFVTCEQILEEVKQKVQIWKREYYEGEREEEAEWKANSG
jgi:molybdopterin synthase catalytic subunit